MVGSCSNPRIGKSRVPTLLEINRYETSPHLRVEVAFDLAMSHRTERHRHPEKLRGDYQVGDNFRHHPAARRNTIHPVARLQGD